MTSEDIRSELEREPFRPFRLHLVSGKVVEVNRAQNTQLLQNALMVLGGDATSDAYDVVALQNIERVELLPLNGKHQGSKQGQGVA